MPKACQTGWFEPSRYRFNVLAGSLVGIRESKAKPVSPKGYAGTRYKRYRKGEPVGRTGQRFSSEQEDKDELSKVTLFRALAPKREVTEKEAGGRQPP
jgi:hypothetical protein